MDETPREGFLEQLRALLRDGLDYVNSLLTLQQARLTSFALSGILFLLQILLAFILGLAAFILFNVAMGLALTRFFGNGLWAVVILGSLYSLLAVLLSVKALRWLRKLNS